LAERGDEVLDRLEVDVPARARWTCAGASSSADQMCARTRIVPSSFFHDQATAVASPEKEASTPTKASARSGISSSERQAA